MYSLTYFIGFGLIHRFVEEWLSERETGPVEHEKQLKIKGNHG